jgi:inosine/xanthosine triphosphatase
VNPHPNGRLSGVRRVRVGTLNPPKLEGVRAAFAAFAPEVTVDGIDVDSGVPEQPVGYEEIIRGARNRASLAAASSECDFGVGIEDGLVALPLADSDTHMNIGCAAVTDGRRTAIGFSSAFAYPPACSEPAVRERQPIGEIFDQLWDEREASPADSPRRQTPSGGPSAAVAPSAMTGGNIGRLSDGVLKRSEYARHGVLCALVAFLQPDLYGIDSGD